MPTIRFPSAVVQGTVVGGTAGNLMAATGASLASIIAGSTTAGTSLLLIYKGTPATFPALTDRSTRASDLLITFTLPNATGSYYDDLGIVNNAARYTIGKHLASQAAAASGTASWFILCRSGTTSMTDKGALIGSVGTTGSGADLEIPDTNIISGNSYQCAGFYINFPQSWTF